MEIKVEHRTYCPRQSLHWWWLTSCSSQTQYPQAWKEMFLRSCCLIHLSFSGGDGLLASSSIYLEKLYQSTIKQPPKKRKLLELNTNHCGKENKKSSIFLFNYLNRSKPIKHLKFKIIHVRVSPILHQI